MDFVEGNRYMSFNSLAFPPTIAEPLKGSAIVFPKGAGRQKKLKMTETTPFCCNPKPFLRLQRKS